MQGKLLKIESNLIAILKLKAMHKVLFIVLFLSSSLLTPSDVHAQEICNNGIDDDNDGLVDLNDVNDCSCIDPNLNPINNSLIPNPSFENRSCCPSSWSQLYCANNWAQATETTSDYFNTCGYTAATSPMPVPNGDGFAGLIIAQDYREYVGACLTQPMIAGQEYAITFNIASVPSSGLLQPCTMPPYGPINFTIYGRTFCPTFPITIGQGGCPGNFGWTILGSTTYTPSVNWGLITITFTPTQNMSAIILGPPCSLPASYPIGGSGTCYPYFFVDNLLLDYTEPIDVSMTQSGSMCANSVVLTASTTATGGTWQWYYEGVALVGETSSTLALNSVGNQIGGYTARYFTSGACGTAYEVNIEPCNLPVELTSFESHCSEDELELTWQTISEYNNDHFEVQHAADGVTFETLALVSGAGHSIEEINYSFFVRDALKLEGYFRLKQVDFDGVNTYSKVIRVDCATNKPIVQLVNGQLRITNVNEVTNCVVSDLAGRVLFNSSDYEVFQLPISGGFFYVYVESNNKWTIHKLHNRVHE